MPRFGDLGIGAYKPGLERIEGILSELGNPHRDLKVIHVAGTNGKGTTASLISSVLTAQGYRVGLYTSPHISSVRERFRIDGEPIDVQVLADYVQRVEPHFEKLQPSFFEAVTAMGFLYFHESEVDILVAETGLGGRLDATNVVNPLVSVITSVGMDHTDILGSDIRQIAREKGGIIKPGRPVITGARGEALDEIRRIARSNSSTLSPVTEETQVELLDERIDGTRFDLKTPVAEYRELTVPSAGRHQVSNAVTAVRTVEVLKPDLPVSGYSIREGLLDVQVNAGLRGRLEVISTEPAIIIDVAHNPEGIHAAIETIQRANPEASISVALGVMADKDVSGIMKLLAGRVITLYPLKLPSKRAATIEFLASEATDAGLAVTIRDDLDAIGQDFLKNANTKDVLLVTGSHQTVELALDEDSSIFNRGGL